MFGLGIFASKAEANSLTFKHTGNWKQPIFNPFTGNKIGNIPIWHFKWDSVRIMPLDFLPGAKIKGILLSKGTEADALLTELGGGVIPVTEIGDEFAFDDTMFPSQGGFTTSTNGGTEYRLIFDNPIDNPNPSSMVIDLSSFGDIMFSSQFNLSDPSLIQAFIIDGSDNLIPVTDVTCNDCSRHSVPEPSSTLGFLALGTLATGSTLLRKKKQHK